MPKRERRNERTEVAFDKHQNFAVIDTFCKSRRTGVFSLVAAGGSYNVITGPITAVTGP